MRILIGRGLDLTCVFSESSLFNFEDAKSLTGVDDDEDPPVPIPTTEVKLIRVENTWLETAREDRTMPVPNTGNPFIGFLVILLLSSVGRARGC